MAAAGASPSLETDNLGGLYVEKHAYNAVATGADGIHFHRDLRVVKGRHGVFVVPGDSPLDLTGRVLQYGANR
jgi:hypothetical protein